MLNKKHEQLQPITFMVQRPATGWKVRGSNLGGDEIFRTHPDRSWGPPNGYRVSFPGVQGLLRGIDHPRRG